MRSRKSCTVVEDEFIGAVNGSVAFAVTQYPLNPGQASTFPWLSQQAKQWEKYHFNFVEFYYKREVSEFATNGTTGKVIMSVDFDASDPPPATKQQMEDSDPRVDGMPCENLRMRLTARQMHALSPVLYVRSGGLPGSSDIKTFDAGNFNIATQGLQNTSEVGELRVRYSVTFTVPVLDSVTTAPRNNTVTMLSQTGGNVTTGSYQNVGFATVITSGVPYTNAGGVLTFPAGNYLIDVSLEVLYSGASVDTELKLLKNAATVELTKDNFSKATAAVVSVSVHSFVSLNGTDTLTAQILSAFTTGTATIETATLRIVAI